MTLAARWRTAAAIAAVTYVLLTMPMALWPMRNVPGDLAFLALYAVIALALAVDVTELVLVFVWRPHRVALLETAGDRSRTAVVMTICDDWDAAYLGRLRPLAAAGHHVFVLDDSTGHACVPVPEGIAVVRRAHRRGAKGGNLNHWLAASGGRYDHVIVLDADSVVSPDAALTLMRAAAHPDNRSTAVFQAKITSWHDGRTNLFERLQGLGARPRARVFERVHAPLDVLLSFGHNQLIRIAALREVGGFEEQLTCEDTVLSLHLATLGWRTALVDAWTYEREPATVGRYVARTTRWARQTVELFTRDWLDVPVRFKLLLCRHMLSYLVPLVGTALLLVSVWAGPASPRKVLSFIAASLSWTQGYGLYATTMLVLTGVFALAVALRAIIARSEGVSRRDLLLGLVFGSGPHVALLIPLTLAILRSAVGLRVRFVPTNLARHGTTRFELRLWTGTLALAVAVCAGAVRHPGGLLLGFNVVWVALFAIAPLTLAVLALLGRRAAAAPPAIEGCAP